MKVGKAVVVAVALAMALSTFADDGGGTIGSGTRADAGGLIGSGTRSDGGGLIGSGTRSGYFGSGLAVIVIDDASVR